MDQALALFGSSGRTDLLVLIAGLGRSYPREIAALTGLPMTTVIRAVDDFERAGVLVSVRLGRSREVRLNPDWFAARELTSLLEALVEREPRYRKLIAGAARRRPRRREKPV
jgi:DNA-binding transcriptional ArsR family regulator